MASVYLYMYYQPMILQCFVVTQYNKSLPSSAMIENELLTVSIHLNGYFSKEVKS